MQSAKAEPEEAAQQEVADEPDTAMDEAEGAEAEAEESEDADEPEDAAEELEDAAEELDSEPEETASEKEAPVPEPEDAPEGPEPAAPDGIDDLFAQLRTGDAEPEAVAAVEPAPVAAEEEPAPVAAEEPESEVPEPSQPEVEPPVAPATAAKLSGDPFELRDRLLLPIENRTLRSVKRRIVDLQNRVLEEIRVGDDDWSPDRSMFTAAVSEDVGRMNQESFVAGYAAAAELLGQAATPPPDRAAAQETSGDFVDGLIESVSDALARTRSSGGGSRQISAAVGRVFRAWRTDEAARRLRRAGLLAYHEGLLGAYPQLGVERVLAVSPGTPCGDCPAGSDATWAPGRGLPAGTKLPPAGPECRDTIVPAA
jgi:hypothetical protein